MADREPRINASGARPMGDFLPLAPKRRRELAKLDYMAPFKGEERATLERVRAELRGGRPR